MTLNQFAKLTPEEQRDMIDLIVIARRRHLDVSDYILETKFRLVDNSAWTAYKRPKDTKTNRSYDYNQSIYSFLWNLEHKLINLKNEYDF